MTTNTVTFAVLHRSPNPLSAVIVNNELIAEGCSLSQIRALHDMARRLSVALGVGLSVHELPHSDQFTWDKIIGMTNSPVVSTLTGERSEQRFKWVVMQEGDAQLHKASREVLAYMWEEGHQNEDTQAGPGDYHSEMVLSPDAPMDGTPYVALVEAYSVAKTGETSVQVKHWDAYHCEHPTVMTHQIDVADQRQANGQLYATAGALEGDLDDMISITMEISTNPLTGVEHVPCVHVHFDSDALACSMFKVGNRILVRPEGGVTLEAFQRPAGQVQESFFWMDTEFSN